MKLCFQVLWSVVDLKLDTTCGVIKIMGMSVLVGLHDIFVTIINIT